MTSAPRSARLVVMPPGPSIETSMIRKPASGAASCGVDMAADASGDAGPSSERWSGLAEEAAHRRFRRVEEAALERVAHRPHSLVGQRHERAVDAGPTRRVARVDVGGDDLELGRG